MIFNFFFAFGFLISSLCAFQTIQTVRPGGSYLKENVRILINYVNGYSVQCPLVLKVNGIQVSFEEIFWINENQHHADNDVFISSLNLIDKAQLTVRINQNYNHISCGYLYQSQYIRIKLWSFTYIDNPLINLRVIPNPTLITLSPLNASFSSISTNINLDSWNRPLDVLRFECETNYDIPLDTKYVWMYYKNPDTNQDEIWHRDDIKGALDPFQIFMYDNYNSVTNRNASLSIFLRSVLNARVNSIEFQCASYKDKFQLLAKSHNYSIIRANTYYTNEPVHQTTTTARPHDHGPLIGGIVGGILGLILLLAIILLIVWCCCIRREKEKNSQVYYNQQQLQSQSVVSAFPIEKNIEITQDGWRNVSINNQADYIHIIPTHSTHTIESTRQHQQTSSRVELANQHQTSSRVEMANPHASSSNLAHQVHRAGIATIRSEVPEVFLKTITLPKDDGGFSKYAQKDITYNSNNGYLTDEEFYTQRNEYFVNKTHSNSHSIPIIQCDQHGNHFQYV